MFVAYAGPFKTDHQKWLERRQGVIDAAAACRSAGNAQFRAGKLDDATKQWEGGLRHLKHYGVTPGEQDSTAERRAMADIAELRNFFDCMMGEDRARHERYKRHRVVRARAAAAAMAAATEQRRPAASAGPINHYGC